MFKSRTAGFGAHKTHKPQTSQTSQTSQTGQTPLDVTEMVTDMANSWEDAVPGGRDFVRQMNRAKAEFFKGVAALVNAEVEQAEQLDAALAAPAKDKKPQKIKVE
jgi:hypothetical protein